MARCADCNGLYTNPSVGPQWALHCLVCYGRRMIAAFSDPPYCEYPWGAVADKLRVEGFLAHLDHGSFRDAMQWRRETTTDESEERLRITMDWAIDAERAKIAPKRSPSDVRQNQALVVATGSAAGGDVLRAGVDCAIGCAGCKTNMDQ